MSPEDIVRIFQKALCWIIAEPSFGDVQRSNALKIMGLLEMYPSLIINLIAAAENDYPDGQDALLQHKRAKSARKAIETFLIPDRMTRRLLLIRLPEELEIYALAYLSNP